MLETCEFCKVKIEWEGSHPKNGLMWICEGCGKHVCSKCMEEIDRKSVNMDEDILCPDCKKKK